MREIVDLVELRAATHDVRCAGGSIGLVPTMGALHAGHVALVERARHDNTNVIMSLFVNPTQFGPGEDFERYPRDLDRDRLIAKKARVDVLFVPTLHTIYPTPQRIWIDPGTLASHFEGAHRPGHFIGVCTVVAKLFHLVQPDCAYFGQKDGQQAGVIDAMVRDLAFPVRIEVVPTVREPDGLALSSRNIYLSPEERHEATAINQALQNAARAIEAGERDPRRLERIARSTIEVQAPLARIEYVSVADLETLEPCETSITGEAMLAVAVFFGRTRLIDNLLIRSAGGNVRVV